MTCRVDGQGSWVEDWGCFTPYSGQFQQIAADRALNSLRESAKEQAWQLPPPPSAGTTIKDAINHPRARLLYLLQPQIQINPKVLIDQVISNTKYNLHLRWHLQYFKSQSLKQQTWQFFWAAINTVTNPIKETVIGMEIASHTSSRLKTLILTSF